MDEHECPRCKYTCGQDWNYCPRCAYDLVDDPHPVQKEDTHDVVQMSIAKLWTVRFGNGPWGMGMQSVVERALEEASIRPVDYMTHHLILLPPMREENMSAVPLDIIQRATEESGKIRVERYWPYGLGKGN